MGNWLRNFGQRLTDGIRRFMMGRYGTDKLNMALLAGGIVVSILGMLIPGASVKLALTILSYGLLFLAILRSLSRNTYKRYEENRKYLMLIQQLKDKEHRYYDCPRCHQQVRVPKGKGKIMITCPKCQEKFTKKT